MNIETTDIKDQKSFDLVREASRIVFLPSNFETDNKENMHFPSTLPTVLKLAKKEGLAVCVFGDPVSTKLLEQRSFEWFAPSMFISSLYFSSNPDGVSIALNMLSNYLTTIFAGLPKSTEGSVSLNIFYKNEKTGLTKKVSYKGPSSGLKEVSRSVKALAREVK
jgi:hypothetical protein